MVQRIDDVVDDEHMVVMPDVDRDNWNAIIFTMRIVKMGKPRRSQRAQSSTILQIATAAAWQLSPTIPWWWCHSVKLVLVQKYLWPSSSSVKKPSNIIQLSKLTWRTAPPDDDDDDDYDELKMMMMMMMMTCRTAPPEPPWTYDEHHWRAASHRPPPSPSC